LEDYIIIYKNQNLIKMNNKINATVLTIAIIIMCSMSSFSQKVSADKVPTAVKTTFAKAFPKVLKAKWELETDNVYEVNFKQSKTKYSAKYQGDGTLMETEMEIPKSAIPANLSKELSKQFAGYKIEEAEKVTYPDGTFVYEFEVEKGKKSLEVQMDVNGNVLKQEEEEEGKDD
jgi:Putative beta-lactamase-inhibitor-like, PepSY-like